MTAFLTIRMFAALQVAALLVIATPQLAVGQAQSPEQLIEAGITARRGGDDEHALALFTQAWASDHSPRARAQMGFAEHALGRLVEAEAHLMEALAASGDAWIAERHAALEEGLVSIRARLAQLEVRADQPGVQLHINGRDAGTLPLARPLWMLPGSVTIALSAPGFAPSTRTVTVSAGQLNRERFELVPLSVTEEPAEVTPRAGAHNRPASVDAPPRDHGGSFLPTLGWVGVGVGAVGLGVGTVVFLVGQSDADSWNSPDCVAPGGTREANCSEFRKAAENAQTLSTISFVAGGALLVGGLALLLFGDGNVASERSTPVSASCQPTFGTATGVACGGRF